MVQIEAITQVTTIVMESPEDFAFVKSFSSGMKVVINKQSSKAHEIKRCLCDTNCRVKVLSDLILSFCFVLTIFLGTFSDH